MRATGARRRRRTTLSLHSGGLVHKGLNGPRVCQGLEGWRARPILTCYSLQGRFNRFKAQKTAEACRAATKKPLVTVLMCQWFTTLALRFSWCVKKKKGRLRKRADTLPQAHCVTSVPMFVQDLDKCITWICLLCLGQRQQFQKPPWRN